MDQGDGVGIQLQEPAVPSGLRALCQSGFGRCWQSSGFSLIVSLSSWLPQLWSNLSMVVPATIWQFSYTFYFRFQTMMWCWPSHLFNQPHKPQGQPTDWVFLFVSIWFVFLVCFIGSVLCRITTHLSLPSIIFNPKQLLIVPLFFSGQSQFGWYIIWSRSSLVTRGYKSWLLIPKTEIVREECGADWELGSGAWVTSLMYLGCSNGRLKESERCPEIVPW